MTDDPDAAQTWSELARAELMIGNAGMHPYDPDLRDRLRDEALKIIRERATDDRQQDD